MPSFSTALSGLDANSQDLTVISNNLANLNTVAYKSDRASFQDLFYQQIGSSGSGNPIQVGVGAGVGSIEALFTQGSTESTGVPTDVAIQGNGFLVVSNGGVQEYTRAGNLSLRADGQLTTADGSLVLGNAAVGGVITPGATPVPLTISQGATSPPKATQNVTSALNLDSDSAIGATFDTSMTVHDALGATHVLTLAFTKTAANTWGYNMTVPGADVGAANPLSVSNGTLTFNGAGELTAPTGNVAGIQIPGLADGASNLTFAWDLYDSSGNPLLTQVSGPSASSSTSDDGYAAGTLQSFSIGSDGTIQGTFSNGQTQALGQIELASFANDQGLLRNGSNNFLASLSSGSPNVGAPGTGGLGTLSGGALEQSNVDISTEFANLILAQQGFEANSKVVTTFDQVNTDAINMKQ